MDPVLNFIFGWLLPSYLISLSLRSLLTVGKFRNSQVPSAYVLINSSSNSDYYLGQLRNLCRYLSCTSEVSDRCDKNKIQQDGYICSWLQDVRATLKAIFKSVLWITCALWRDLEGFIFPGASYSKPGTQRGRIPTMEHLLTILPFSHSGYEYPLTPVILLGICICKCI